MKLFIQLLAYRQHFIANVILLLAFKAISCSVRALGKHPSLLLFAICRHPGIISMLPLNISPSSPMASPSEQDRVSSQLDCESVSSLLGLLGYLASALFQDKTSGFMMCV